MKIKLKRGNSIITIPIILAISIITIIYLGIYIINSMLPFIYHQKLTLVANKYMFVIEKFGYLTDDEKESLKDELKNLGFELSQITLKYPSERKNYGELIELEIGYKLVIKTPVIDVSGYNIKEKETILKVRKNSFSKI